MRVRFVKVPLYKMNEAGGDGKAVQSFLAY